MSAALDLAGVRNSLLPEGSLSARFTTTTGPKLDQVSGTVYVGTHHGQEQRMLWIKIEEKLLPTGWLLYIIKEMHECHNSLLVVSIHIMATSSINTSAAYTRSGSAKTKRWC